MLKQRYSPATFREAREENIVTWEAFYGSDVSVSNLVSIHTSGCPQVETTGRTWEDIEPGEHTCTMDSQSILYGASHRPYYICLGRCYWK